MDWICSVCSTLNDEKSRKCMVCNTSRLRSSIIHKKLSFAKRRSFKIDDCLCKSLEFSVKTSTIVVVFIVAVFLMIKIIGGSLLNNIYDNSVYLIKSSGVGDKFTSIFSSLYGMLKNLFFKIYHSAVSIGKMIFDTDIFENIKYIFYSFADNLKASHVCTLIKKFFDKF